MAPEKRGTAYDEAAGCSQLLVLRRGALRIFRAASARQRGPPISTIHLAFQCEVQVLSGSRFEVKVTVPYDSTYTFRVSSSTEAEAWSKALADHRSDALKKTDGHLRFLEQGCTAYKYNYSNSKRMRRHFWVDVDRVELCWGKNRSEEPQTMDLKDSMGIIYGPLTTTFSRCATLEDPAWCCFSLLFPDRTLDLAVPGDEATERWFFGLQHLLLNLKSTGCVSVVSEAQFGVKRVSHKLRDSARRHQMTMRRLVTNRVRALGQDRGFCQALGKLDDSAGKTTAGGYPPSYKPSNGGGGGYPGGMTEEDPEAAAKAERRRKKRESKVELSASAAVAAAGGATSAASDGTSKRRSKAADGGTDGAFADGAADQAEEDELTGQIAELERELEDSTSKLESLRPQWETKLSKDISLDTLGEVLRSSDDFSWQAEKCGEFEREALTLRSSNKRAERQLLVAEKAEKQLKKLAKHFKESEARVKELKQELEAAQAGGSQAETAKFSSSAAQERAEAQKSHLERRVGELKLQLQEGQKGQETAATHLKEKNKKQREELSKLEQAKADVTKQFEQLLVDTKSVGKQHADNQQKLVKYENSSQVFTDSLRKLQKAVSTLQAAQKQVKGDCQTQLRSISDSFPPLNGAVQKIGAEMVHTMENVAQIAEERKKLHNLVLELKGNIRVFVRVRPMNERETNVEPAGEKTITFAEDIKMSVYEETTSRRKWFDFDRVFSPKTFQNEVFEEVKPLATSVLDGYNVCIFAYGQTGSGKTFTMTGNDANPGLNTRTLTELFKIKEERKLELDIKISMSVTEIYNETIKDLFVTKEKKLEVQTNKDGSNSVPGLTELPMHTVEDVLKAMKEAQGNRTTMATEMNEESSRSHSIVQVKTMATSLRDKREFIGKINLIDLAGSENVNKSGVSGQGMREAQNINKSLSALGDVIQSLVSKGSHVPYRNSKLTMMLKDSLGGDSKTLMIVQASPAQCNSTETLSSLNFAARARCVELGKAKRNVKGGD